MIKSNSKDWKPVVIELEDSEINMNFGMNSSPFYNDMQWQPEYDLDKTIVSLSEYFMKEIMFVNHVV